MWGALRYDDANVEFQFDNVEQNRTNIATEAWVPWYTMHKILAGLLDAYTLAGNAQALSVAEKLGDWVCGRAFRRGARRRRRRCSPSNTAA